MANGACVETQLREALVANRAAWAEGMVARAPQNALLGSEANQGIDDFFSSGAPNTLQKAWKSSGWTRRLQGERRFDPQKHYRTQNVLHG